MMTLYNVEKGYDPENARVLAVVDDNLRVRGPSKERVEELIKFAKEELHARTKEDVIKYLAKTLNNGYLLFG